MFAIKKESKNYLSDLCDTFSLLNLISGVTCINSSVGSSIDVMLTNGLSRFHHTSLIETGMSDCHKLLSLFRAFFKRIPAKTIEQQIQFRNFSPRTGPRTQQGYHLQ